MENKEHGILAFERNISAYMSLTLTGNILLGTLHISISVVPDRWMPKLHRKFNTKFQYECSVTGM